mmetsp:Transcript_4153/g.7992  ORF Transcript_4153/g.7992 Transcript_4153/m.7992 type:complete len:218 (-) Transcript_4153:59-712(-)
MITKIPKFNYDKEKLLLFIKNFKKNKENKKYFYKIKTFNNEKSYIFTINFSDIFQFFSTQFNYDPSTIINFLFNTNRYLKIISIIFKEILITLQLQNTSKLSTSISFIKILKKTLKIQKKKIKIYIHPSIFHNTLIIEEINFKNIGSLIKIHGVIKAISKNYVFMNSITETNFIKHKFDSISKLDDRILNLLTDKVTFKKNFTHVKFIILHEQIWEV